MNGLVALLLLVGVGGMAGVLYTGTRDVVRDMRDAWRAHRARQRALTYGKPVAWE